MRLRHKPKAVAALPRNEFYIENPQEYCGLWNKVFHKQLPISLELGCGFGQFSTTYSNNNKDKNIIAIDKSRDVLVGACRLVKASCGDKPENLRLTDLDAYDIERCFCQSDGVQELFIFFCNPWPKRSHHRRRLTYPTLLEKYKSFLKPGARLYFKTDDKDLFWASLRYFDDCDLDTVFSTENLTSEHDHRPLLIETEYENKFRALGQPIYAAVVKF